MPDAAGKPGVRDVYLGHTNGSLEDDILDQDGSQVGATDTDKLRVRRWMKEAIDQVQAEVGMDEVTQRDTTLTVEAGVVRYALDYDVLEVLRVVDSEGKSMRLMDAREAQDRLTYNDGAWLDTDNPPTTFIHEELDANGRMIVRVEPAPTAAATYTLWYQPKVSNLDDRDMVLPLPTIFHPAVEAYCKAKLHERQEDKGMLEAQMGIYQMRLNTARARYRPMRPIQEAFQSSYQDRPTHQRAPGRMRHGN